MAQGFPGMAAPAAAPFASANTWAPEAVTATTRPPAWSGADKTGAFQSLLNAPVVHTSYCPPLQTTASLPAAGAAMSEPTQEPPDTVAAPPATEAARSLFLSLRNARPARPMARPLMPGEGSDGSGSHSAQLPM